MVWIKNLNETPRDEDIEFMFIVTSRNYHLDLEVSTYFCENFHNI